jgi:pimeloyl-ACP methyl ester carboxylesterase
METSIKKAFLIPGLALNPEVTGNIELEGYEKVYIRWIDPAGEESLESYAQRIIDIYQILENESIIILGHSFGGLLAQQIASVRPLARLILISTVKDSSEIPWKIRFLKHGFAYHLASKKLILRTLSLWGWYHGYDEPELHNAFVTEVSSLSNDYLIWAYKRIIHWEGIPTRNEFIHIHGDMDKTFPIENIGNCLTLSGGDHLMVFKRSTEINILIASFLLAQNRIA